MKNNSLKSAWPCQVMVLLAFLLLAALLLLPVPAQAQGVPGTTPYQPNFYRTDTNASPLTLTNGGAAVFPQNGTNSIEQTVKQNTGLSVFVTVISSNSVGGTGKVGFDVTPDGTVYTTTQPLSLSFPTAAAVTGTLATNVYWTNWPAATLNNVRQIQWTTATNALVGGGPTTNTVKYSVTYSYSNQ